MTRRFELASELPASRDRAWEVFAATQHWHEWSAFVPRVEGDLFAGETLRLTLRGLGGVDLIVYPAIISIEPPSQVVLEMSLGARGLVHMVHAFEFEPIADDRSRLVQRWDATGRLVWPLWPVLTRMMGRFRAFNDDLARRLSQRP